MRRLITRSGPLTAVTLGLILLARPARAQSWGVHAGVTADPKQAVAGIQLESSGLAPHLELTFRPTIEAGFGGGQTRVNTSLDFIFSVPFSRTWRGYVGGGPSAVYVHESSGDCGFGGCEGGANAMHGSVEGLVGFRNTGGLFVEVESSRFPNPSFRLTVGVTFGHRR